MRRRARPHHPGGSGAFRPTAGRVVGLPPLLRLVAGLRRRRKRPRVVLANGVFDLLHVGHLRYLRAARALGDLLVVAVNDDRSARRLRGPGRPVVPARDRARIIAALRGVGLVVIFGSRTASPLIARLRPEVQCKGTDYTARSVPERAAVLACGGRVRIAGDPKRHAATDLIGRIARRAGGAGAVRER